ncbi:MULTISPECIES: Maf family protein [Rhodanobacter]|uniref:Maf family protein n=1 Tax=Rhodanobacter TaxID=75309 RepID=UPI0002FE118D|nr:MULTISPECIES: Maf family protein [Rhodanobacter]UJJ52205.1 Maf family nucleotide pyrophosphatase [Rhodanobacter denitrificans]UJJ59015.1 Maf family nucleotide pyrophosphatase [Rhodanobacter denitrificans]UJM89478.1 Maf family nucleotide pyrophosphatase [Rhodanobacter denitrificans]UJM94952.1 Maf family nucleotide pyrophosphatase [Rhodanobacter denitrificans]UJM98482.1 Maf family nucleotide pyrophosphatase [Rhodanobacter denitrificans]
MSPRLYLASQSPRRHQLLEQLGADFVVLDVDVPEQRAPGESPRDYVSRVARDKACAGLAALAHAGDALVLGADTEVVLDDDEVFGKPRDAADAAAMLRRLSGRTHAVVSAVWLVGSGGERCEVCVSQVRFATLDEPAIAAYVATGEPFGKAGAYAIQGRGAAMVEHLDGSYSGVMGLPLFETARLLRRGGISPAG